MPQPAAGRLRDDAEWALIEVHVLGAPTTALREADGFVDALIRRTRTGDLALLEDYHIARALTLRAGRRLASVKELHEALALYRKVAERIARGRRAVR